VLNIPGGALSEGAPADVTVLAPDMPVIIRASAFESKSKNTPFDGWQLRGAVAATLVAGRRVFTAAAGERT
jgi:dihydroorotase